MNQNHYGISKQPYRTSYSPAAENNRPSSLNNQKFSHLHHPSILYVRPESNIPTLLVSKNTLSNSQTRQGDSKLKMHSFDYYN